MSRGCCSYFSLTRSPHAPHAPLSVQSITMVNTDDAYQTFLSFGMMMVVVSAFAATLLFIVMAIAAVVAARKRAARATKSGSDRTDDSGHHGHHHHDESDMATTPLRAVTEHREDTIDSRLLVGSRAPLEGIDGQINDQEHAPMVEHDRLMASWKLPLQRGIRAFLLLSLVLAFYGIRYPIGVRTDRHLGWKIAALVQRLLICLVLLIPIVNVLTGGTAIKISRGPLVDGWIDG